MPEKRFQHVLGPPKTVGFRTSSHPNPKKVAAYDVTQNLLHFRGVAALNESTLAKKENAREVYQALESCSSKADSACLYLFFHFFTCF
jgi:hypothetical protein